MIFVKLKLNQHIPFRICLGPRINAGGRVGKSSHGAELLISNDPQKAYKIALIWKNSIRKDKLLNLIYLKKLILK